MAPNDNDLSSVLRSNLTLFPAFLSRTRSLKMTSIQFYEKMFLWSFEGLFPSVCKSLMQHRGTSAPDTHTSRAECESNDTKLASKRQQSLVYAHLQFSSVVQSCLTLCDPMDCGMPGLPVHHQLPELTQSHVPRVGDAIQPSHPQSSPSPPAFNLSQHQGLFQ